MELGGCPRNRLASANRIMKPITSPAASRSQRLGSRRRASIETGGRIFISSLDEVQVRYSIAPDPRKAGPAGADNHFGGSRESKDWPQNQGAMSRGLDLAGRPWVE